MSSKKALCPVKNRDFSNKPKKKGIEYIWKEVNGNPNLYCWIPQKTNSPPKLTDLSIQDIPPSKVEIQPEFEDILEEIIKEGEEMKRKESLKKLKHDKSVETLVSVDDPKKYKIVKEFIKRKGLKVYGGVAINSYLGEEDKFYSPKEIPDYDCFSPDPWNDAMELADDFYRAGYPFVEAKAGIHKGTYKVAVNFWPVADLSYIPLKEFDKMKTHSKNGIKFVDPFKLMESMQKEFSEPFVQIGRWPKVAIRQKLLEKWTGLLNKKFSCSKDLFSGGGEQKIDPLHADLLEIAFKYIKKSKMIFTGGLCFNTYMGLGGSNKRVLIDHYTTLSENAEEDSKTIFTALVERHPYINIVTTYYSGKELNPTVYSLYYKEKKNDTKSHLICDIAQLTNCTPYQIVSGIYIASIDYLKYNLFYGAVFGNTKQETEDAKCLLKQLTYVQEEYYKNKGIKETDKSPFQRFIIKCKGPFQFNLKVGLLERLLDRIEDQKYVIKEKDDYFRTRRYPRDAVPKECIGKEEEDCKYPCGWNKFANKCSGIPKGVYRPDMKDEDAYYRDE